MQKELTYCRMAPSLGSLEDTPENVWGTPVYDPDKHRELPTVFFGLYGLPDFYALWRHKGKKYILWAGSDIRHFAGGYWLNDDGSMRIQANQLANWINASCESYVENTVEQELLKQHGIDSNIVPSFLGKVENFPESYAYDSRPQMYTSVSGDDFMLYGWHEIPDLAEQHKNVDFHLYGNTIPFPRTSENIHVHGRIPKEIMNAEIKGMTGALRLTAFDGFSEILAKSVLWGQWPVSRIKYDHMLSVEDIPSLFDKRQPNTAGREHYLALLNNYPWTNV